ncbi:MAG: RNA 2',3'-cyclic phosphodiesterase [Candidatus Thorarchaeota archaeon]
MIRSFIALELKNDETIEKITFLTSRLKQNQPKLKIVKPENFHMTVKFLGNIPEPLAPKIYLILKEDINEALFQGNFFKYRLNGVGQFNKFSVVWIKLVGDIQFLQEIKDTVENLLYDRLNIDRDKRKQFKPHLTIGRLRKERINYKTFDKFKKIINEYKNEDFGEFTIQQVKLKKSELTPKGPIYSDLVF